MASLDVLPGDQRAVLQLVLGRGRSYDEIARLLSIDPDAVRERALAALDALGPQTRASDENRMAVCDYLLGQLPDSDRPRVHDLLARSAAERAWAQAVSGELGTIAAGPLPEIPEAQSSTATPETPPAAEIPPATPAVPASPAVVIDRADPQAHGDQADPPAKSGRQSVFRRRRRSSAEGDASPPPPPSPPGDSYDDADSERPSSRRGGMVVIGIAAIVIIVVLVLVFKHSGLRVEHQHDEHEHRGSRSLDPAEILDVDDGRRDRHHRHRPRRHHRHRARRHHLHRARHHRDNARDRELDDGRRDRRRQSAPDQPQPARRRPSGQRGRDRGHHSPGLGHRGRDRRPARHAQHQEAAQRLRGVAVQLAHRRDEPGFVNPGVGAKGKLVAAGKWPTDALNYKYLIVTVETTDDPQQPGPIVLEGTTASAAS